MRLLLLSTAIFAPLAMAQTTHTEADYRNGMLFLESVSMPKRAVVCTALGDTYRISFAQFLPTWIDRHKKEIAAGEKSIREVAKKNGIAFEANIEAVTNTDARLLKGTSDALRKENCDRYLESLRNG